MLDAGAHLVGKTHTDELTWSLTGENAHYGAPVNVNAPGRITGGSSSGSASAVAAGVVDFAVGSDTGGSVRLPASFCGILGIRPTHGRIPLDGVCPLAPSFDTCGWFARDADILQRVGRTLLCDDAPAPPPGRLLIAQDTLEIAGETVVNALRPTLDKLAALVRMPEPVIVADEPLTRWMDYFRVLQAAEAWACHGEWIAREKPALGPGVKERFAWAPTVRPEDIARARRGARRLRADSRNCLKDRPCSRCPLPLVSHCRATHRRKSWTICAFERWLCCALPAWRGCRKFHCRWRRWMVVRSGSRLLPRAATIRSCSNWPPD